MMQKLRERFAPNLMDGWEMGQERAHFSLAQIWTKGRSQEMLITFSNTAFF